MDYFPDTKTIFTSYKCSVDEPIIQSILGKWKLLNPSIIKACPACGLEQKPL